MAGILYLVPAYCFTIKIFLSIDISTKIKKYLPIKQFGLGEAIFVDTMKLLPDSDSYVQKKPQKANCDLDGRALIKVYRHQSWANQAI